MTPTVLGYIAQFPRFKLLGIVQSRGIELFRCEVCLWFKPRWHWIQYTPAGHSVFVCSADCLHRLHLALLEEEAKGEPKIYRSVGFDALMKLYQDVAVDEGSIDLTAGTVIEWGPLLQHDQDALTRQYDFRSVIQQLDPNHGWMTRMCDPKVFKQGPDR